MGDKSTQKISKKKVGKTLKEKRSAKKLKHDTKSAALIPPTGH